MKRPGGPTLLLLVSLGCLSAGLWSCAPSPEGGVNATIHQELQSGDPNARIAAMQKAVTLKDDKAVPLIVECLGSDEGDVRMYACMALQKLTGRTMGYIFYAPRDSRERAIEQWRAWLKAGRPADFTPAATPDGPAATTTTSEPATTTTAPATGKAQP